MRKLVAAVKRFEEIFYRFSCAATLFAEDEGAQNG